MHADCRSPNVAFTMEVFTMSHNSISLKRFALLASAVACAALMTGCQSMVTTATSTGLVQTGSLTGVVHGGQIPIYNATVTLWAAGNTGYGSTATSLATTNTLANGSFSFQPGGVASYSCPSSGSATESQYLYLTAVGGQPLAGTTNSVSAMLLPLGLCSTVLSTNPSVIINEVTTVAGMFALQQFFTPSSGGLGNIGAPSTNITGLANAFATAGVLIFNGGSTVTTVNAPVAGFNTANPSLIITPEISKIYLEANILAACINTGGAVTGPSNPTACYTLFNDVNGTAAKDTLQAAYYMAVNPTSTVSSTSNIGTLFNLAASQSPFAPALTPAPTDWSIGVTYGSNSKNAAGAYLIAYPTYLAVDGSGNIWVVNDSSGAAATTANSVTELSPSGTPLAQVLTGNTLIGPAGIALDPSGNIYVPNYGTASVLQSYVSEYTTGGVTKTFPTNSGPQRVAIDGKGNVFVLEPSYKGGGDLEEIPALSANNTAATTLATGLTTDFSNLAIDSNYSIWVTGGGTGSQGGTAGYPYVYQFLYNGLATPNYTTTPSATVNLGGVTAPEQAIAIDNSNNVFVQNYGAETLAEFSGTSGITGNASSPYTMPATLTKPEFAVVDGANNLWVSNAVSTAGPVFEVSDTGVPVAPTVGYAHTYAEPYGIAVDPSGNVWVANYNSSASATVQAFITEIVGQAVPVVTPLSAGLPSTPGGVSKLGTKP